MPIPKPRKNEKKKDFMGRCMGDDVMNTEYPKSDQRYAVCLTSWDNKGKKGSEEEANGSKEKENI